MKSGIIVVKNEKEELILTRPNIGWRVWVDYKMQNILARNDYCFLVFLYQTLEKVVGYLFYYVHGCSWYFQIGTTLKDWG